MFTNDALEKLKLRGLKTTPVLHINVTNNDRLLKPVTFKFTMKELAQRRGKMVILRDNNDTFEDITDELFEDDETTVTQSENYFSFDVAHFSR